ncbi:hypothetical protein F4779DRAFT_494891 [Xylariaceae sp. FL0662B]|nr:hypothetical protein F4779DRAFT_494891 [Xylariaceae sp. FL0662B]
MSSNSRSHPRKTITVPPENIDKISSTLQSPPSTPVSCIMCEKDGRLECSKCRAAPYCSPECQRKDWSFHRHLCTTSSEYKDDAKPSQTMWRTLLFRENSRRPQWVWVENKKNSVSWETFRPFLRTESRLEVLNAYIPHRKVGHLLVAVRRDEDQAGSGPESFNKGIAALGKPGHIRVRYGPVVVCALQLDEKGAASSLKDISMRDLRHIVDAFRAYSRNPCVPDIDRYPFKDEMLPAVKINCPADQQRFNIPAIEEVMTSTCWLYSEDDRVYPNSLVPCALALCVGLPWAVCKPDKTDLPAYPEGRENEASRIFSNGFCISDAGSSEYWLDICRNPPQQSITIVHMKALPIRAAHVKVLDYYAQQIFRTHDIEEEDPLQATITCFAPQFFRAFWDVHQHRNAIPGVDLRGIPSPYEWQRLPQRGFRLNFGHRWTTLLRGAIGDDAYSAIFADA